MRPEGACATRVIGGRLGGRPLAAPAGRETRPTPDRVRGALFDALTARGEGLRDLRVLDLFSGSGALAIEALSRGAAAAWCVERAPAALAVLRRNVEALGLGSCLQVLARDAWAVLGGEGLPAGACFQLVLADPPYAVGALALLAAVAAAPWLAPGARCAFEHAVREELPARSGTLRRVWRRVYGGTAVSVYEAEAEA